MVDLCLTPAVEDLGATRTVTGSKVVTLKQWMTAASFPVSMILVLYGSMSVCSTRNLVDAVGPSQTL